MGGDTGKIIGYVALAAAVVVATGPAGAGLWGAKTGAVAGGTAGAGAGAGAGATATKGATSAMTLGGTGSTGSYAAGTVPVNFAGGAGASGAGALVPSASWGSQALGSLGTAAKGLGSTIAENPLASYMIGQGALTQMNTPQVQDMAMPDFASLQQAQTYEQTLSNMDLNQLNNELARPGISQAESNSVARAMRANGLSDDRIRESQARALHGEQRYQEVSKTMGDFNDATTLDQGDLDAQAALIYATYRDDSDRTFNDAKTQLKQQFAKLGRLGSQGYSDQFTELAGNQARHNTDLQQKAMQEAMRRNTSNADLQLKGANAILAGANYGDTLDRYNANLNENNRRFQLADLKGQSEKNYNTNLLGLQGVTNYNLGKYQTDKASADAQAMQGLEMAKLGMRGFDDLVPLGRSRDLYYGI